MPHLCPMHYVAFKGGGQSFGAFSPRHLVKLQGATNDYVGKGLGGDRRLPTGSPAARKISSSAIR
jgi:hypothetical protein